MVFNLDFLDKYKDRIQKSKELIKRFWNFEKTSYIPTIVYNYPNYNLRQEMLVPWDKYLLDKELSLKVKLKSIEEHLKYINDEYIPVIDTFIGTPVIASTFGGKVDFFRDKDPWIKSRIINDLKDIDSIKKPDPRKTGLAKKTLEFIDYWKIETDGKIPVSIPDIQGPLSVGIDLMGAQKFYLGLFDDPNRMHKLLGIIAETVIDFLKILYSKIEEEDGLYEWTGIFFPKGKGRVRISEDNLISISPDIYLEFLQPYNEMILKEVGGGIIHWCGDGSNNFESVLTTQNLTGVHNSSMGDMNLIISQISRLNNIKEKDNKKLVYFNLMALPSRKSTVKELLEEQKGFNGLVNQIFLPTNNFGTAFYTERKKQGYEKFIDEPIDIMNEFLRDKSTI
jgi:hypothetical protein